MAVPRNCAPLPPTNHGISNAAFMGAEIAVLSQKGFCRGQGSRDLGSNNSVIRDWGNALASTQLRTHAQHSCSADYPPTSNDALPWDQTTSHVGVASGWPDEPASLTIHAGIVLVAHHHGTHV